VTGLRAKAFDFGYHQTGDPKLGQCFAHLFELEGFDGCYDQFHLVTLSRAMRPMFAGAEDRSSRVVGTRQQGKDACFLGCG
jgi:hypothetical protein